MHLSKWIPVATSFLLFSGAAAQRTRKTDAQTDGLNGPVKSVITTTFRHDIHWRQPDGISLVLSVSCQECDYDPDGSRVRSQGDNILLLRDAQGHISDRRILTASTGSLKVHEVFGPFGLTEQTYYEQGKVSSSRTLRYDPFGHVSETFSFDSSGQQVEHTHSTFNKDGVLIEDSTWGKNGQLKWQQLFDSQAKTESFATFDEAGVVQLAWTQKDGKMAAFWERSEEDNQYGACQIDDEAEDGTRDTHCFANGNRERAVIRYQYMEPKGINLLKSAEWRDGAGKLLYAAYYNYELDTHSNWTRRTIWVVSPKLPERTLYEEDTRLVAYW
jgi:hypothetical protein